MKRVFPISLLLMGLSIVSGAQTPPAAYDDADAYAVYAAIIVDDWPVKVAKARKLVIETETKDNPFFYERNGHVCLKPAAGEETTLEPLIEAYEKANKQTLSLQRKFVLPLEYELVPRENITALFKTKGIGGWKDFYDKYPNSGGSIHMSAVGFNADKKLALVYMGHSCGGLCGGGSYHLMKKLADKWFEIPWNGISCNWAS